MQKYPSKHQNTLSTIKIKICVWTYGQWWIWWKFVNWIGKSIQFFFHFFFFFLLSMDYCTIDFHFPSPKTVYLFGPIPISIIIIIIINDRLKTKANGGNTTKRKIYGKLILISIFFVQIYNEHTHTPSPTSNGTNIVTGRLSHTHTHWELLP